MERYIVNFIHKRGDRKGLEGGTGLRLHTFVGVVLVQEYQKKVEMFFSCKNDT